MAQTFAQWAAKVASMRSSAVARLVNSYKLSRHNGLFDRRSVEEFELERWNGLVVLRQRQLELATKQRDEWSIRLQKATLEAEETRAKDE